MVPPIRNAASIVGGMRGKVTGQEAVASVVNNRDTAARGGRISHGDPVLHKTSAGAGRCVRAAEYKGVARQCGRNPAVTRTGDSAIGQFSRS